MMTRIFEVARRWWPVLLLWGLVLGYFASMLSPIPSLRTFLVSGDFTNQVYPYRYFAAAEWWQGRIPLWNPYMYGGHPFQADIQSAVFYPLNLLSSFTGGPGGLSFLALEMQVVLDYLLAATFSYLFIRRLAGGTVAGLIGAIIFTFSGFLTSYPMLSLPVLESAVWLPLVLFFIEKGMARPDGSLANLSLAGLALGVSLLAGHPQTAMYLAYTSLAYLLYRAIALRIAWRGVVERVAVFALAATGLAAVQALPTLEFFQLSTRSGALDYEMIGHGYELASLPGLLLPDWRGEKALYLGGASLMLIAMAWQKPKGQVIFWSGAALTALALSLGKNGFLFPLFYTVAPGFSLFRDQERVMLVFALALAVLSARGWQVLVGMSASKITWQRLAGLAGIPLLALLLGALLAWLRAPEFDPHFPVWLSWFRLALISLPLLVVASLWLVRRLPVGAVGLAVVLLLLADLFWLNLGNNLSPAFPLPSAELVSAAGALQDHPEPYRIMPDNDGVLPANYGILARAPHLAGDTPMILWRMAELLDQPNGWRVWQLFNVKFSLTRQQRGEEFELVRQVGDVNIYYVKYSFPRIWVVNDIRLASGEQEARAMTLSEGLNPGKTAVLEQPPALSLSPGQSLAEEWQFISYNSWWLKVRVKTAANGLLVLSETHYPGWKAYVDGREVPILRANYALRAVELPTGTHIVEMHYRPFTFVAGAAISLLTLAVVGIAAWRRKPAVRSSIPA